MVDGAMTIRDFNRATDWSLPDEEANTLAGLVIHEAQMIPSRGAVFLLPRVPVRGGGTGEEPDHAADGGGVVGCSVAYHLTKLGWSDVMLLERSELTSGSTWHAAGGFHTLNGDTNMAALQGYTIRLYRELEEITGSPAACTTSAG
jgi:hypothetical protein